MKRIFKGIFLAFISLLSITACDSVIPVMRRSSRERSESEKIDVSVPDYVEITCEEDPIHILVGETYTTNHYLYDKKNDVNLRLEDGSEALSFGSSLKVESNCFFNYLTVTISCDVAGDFSYEVNMVSSEGYVASQTFEVLVEPLSDYCSVEMNVPNRFIPYREYGAIFRIFNPSAGNYLRFDQKTPYRIVHKGVGLNIKRFNLDDQYTLSLILSGTNEANDFYTIELKNARGDFYRVEFYYIVLSSETPMYHFDISPDPFVVEDLGSGEVTIRLKDEQNNDVEFDTTYWNLVSDGNNFRFEFIELDRYYFKFRIINLVPGTKTSYDVFLRDYLGYNTNCRLDVFTSSYFNETPELIMAQIEYHTGEKLVYLAVRTMSQRFETITKVRVTSKYNRISDVVIDGLNVTEYRYSLSEHPSGSDRLAFEVTTANGVTYDGTIDISI